jgi:hypothetical protein
LGKEVAIWQLHAIDIATNAPELMESLEFTFTNRINRLVCKGDTLFIAGTFRIGTFPDAIQNLAAVSLPGFNPLPLSVGFASLPNDSPTVSDIEVSNTKLFAYKQGVKGRSFFSVDLASFEINQLPISPVYITSQSVRVDLTIDAATDQLFVSNNRYAYGDDDALRKPTREGYVTSLNNQRYNIALFSKSGESLTTIPQVQTFFPRGHGNPPFANEVSDILLYNDTLMFVSGGFELFVSAAALFNNFMSVNLLTGELYPELIVDDAVYKMKRNGNSILLAGKFETINFNEPIRSLVEYNPQTEMIRSLNIPTNSEVWGLDLTEYRILIGGKFNSVDGNTARNLALIDINSEEIELIPLPESPKAVVYDVAFWNDGYLVGGGFAAMGKVKSRKNFAVIDMNTKEVLPFAPNPDGPVENILVDGENIFVSGSFSEFDVATAQPIVRVNKNSFASESLTTVVSFLPDSKIEGTDVDENNLYVVGDFDTSSSLNQQGIAAFDKSTGQIQDWPAQSLDAVSEDAVFFNCKVIDDLVFVMGDFTVGSEDTERKDIFAIDRLSGEYDDFKLDLTVNDCPETEATDPPRVRQLFDILEENNDFCTLFGDFRIKPCDPVVPPYNINGSGRLSTDTIFDIKGLMRVDRLTAENSNYGTGIPGDYTLWKLEPSSVFRRTYGLSGARYNETLYFGGKGWLTGVDVENDELTDWIGSGSDWGSLKKYRKIDGITYFDWSNRFTANAVEVSGDRLFVGGDFQIIGGANASRLAIYRLDCAVDGGSISTEALTQDICLNDQTMNPMPIEVSEGQDLDTQILFDFNNNVIDYTPNSFSIWMITSPAITS